MLFSVFLAITDFYISARRIFLMGPPGSNRKENALALAEHFGWSCISIGDLLKKEVSKKSDYGKAISDNIKNSTYGKFTSPKHNFFSS